jgi:hypothetical protein
MNVLSILRCLPSSLDWAVLFRLSATRKFTNDSAIRKMYYLPDDLDLEPFSHVILTSAGKFLAPGAAEMLHPVQPDLPTTPGEGSLLDSYEHLLNRFPVDEADCLGLGTKAPWPPVVLFLQARTVQSEAMALFRKEPDRTHYELLRTVGVEYIGGGASNGLFVARFRNNLMMHFQAADLSGYSRTGNCNDFFLQHGEIDPSLESGLLQATQVRIQHGATRSIAAAALLARRACRERLPMICQPPAPEQPYPFGDLVPSGFLLRLFSSLPSNPLAISGEPLRENLYKARQGKLWSFHTGRLVTSTDSALILQGLHDSEAVEELERFSDGSGGYYPQLWSEEPKPGYMQISNDNPHWRQTDFATTCLVRSLRIRAGLPERTTAAWLERRIDQRAGLFFANPYLVDWVLAQALETRTETADLRRRLIASIADSRNDDFSFGRYDKALSTALAILALTAAGSHGRLIRMAQLRLLEFMEPNGQFPRSTPFYSSLLSERKPGENPQIIDVAGQAHELWLYHDSYASIGTAVAAMALSEPCNPEIRDIDRPQSEDRERYECPDAASYIRLFALPPYMKKDVAE